MTKIVIPNGPLLAELNGGWSLYQLPRHPKYGSPLWIELKLLNRHLPKQRRLQSGRLGSKRTYRLCWGVDAARLRRDAEGRELIEREPALYAGLEAFLKGVFTPERTETKIGAEALAAERVRIAEAASTAAKARAERRALREMMS